MVRVAPGAISPASPPEKIWNPGPETTGAIARGMQPSLVTCNGRSARYPISTSPKSSASASTVQIACAFDRRPRERHVGAARAAEAEHARVGRPPPSA